ncbi:MAG: hypothetical protein OEV30_07030 [Ignavibacteria bacterium]|nr:hypothetical protein [Ignavibacteria bacterium]
MRKAWLLPVIVFMLHGCRSGEPLGPEEMNEMKAAQMQYSVAWMTNDPEEVMNTFTSNPIIVPSGMSAIEGAEAARAFWWPEEGPLATITRFEMVQEQAGGHGDLGYVRGTFFLEFDYEGESHKNEGEFVSLLERGNAGWKISTHMWNDFR